MRVYVDTSVLVAAHVREPHTDLAQRWFSEQGSGLLFSMWGLVECDSALAIKRRRRRAWHCPSHHSAYLIMSIATLEQLCHCRAEFGRERDWHLYHTRRT
jgi:hypothetical protein